MKVREIAEARSAIHKTRINLQEVSVFAYNFHVHQKKCYVEKCSKCCCQSLMPSGVGKTHHEKLTVAKRIKKLPLFMDLSDLHLYSTVESFFSQLLRTVMLPAT
jgi:hypothetical protein